MYGEYDFLIFSDKKRKKKRKKAKDSDNEAEDADSDGGRKSPEQPPEAEADAVEEVEENPAADDPTDNEVSGRLIKIQIM